MALGLAVGVWVARYLGPADFGRLSFALSLVLLFEPLRSLGLNGIAMRDLVRRPEAGGGILGAAWLLKLAGGLAVLIVAPAIAFGLRPLDQGVLLMVLVIALAGVVRSADAMELAFQAALRAKLMVLPQIAANLAQSLLRVGLILAGAGAVWFSGAVLFEAVVLALALFAAHRISGLVRGGWRARGDTVRDLLRQSWPLMFAGAFTTIFLHIDRIMLGQLVGDEAVGVYSVAVTLSMLPGFLALALVHSAYPTLVEAEKRARAGYWTRLRKLGRGLVALGLSISAVTIVAAEWMIDLLYGDAYQASASILRVHVVSVVFLNLGYLRNAWAMVEGRTRVPLIANLSGAIANVALNFLLIPLYGPVGAAYATVAACFIAGLLAHLFIPTAWPLLRLQLVALFFLPELRAALPFTGRLS